MEPIRSLLFVPGNRPNMLERASTVPADVLVPDLEDSVPLTEKAAARDIVKKALPHLAQRGQMVCVRVNSLNSGLIQKDLEAVLGTHIYGISVGKIDSKEDIIKVEKLIAALEEEHLLPKGQTRLLPWLETAKGIVRAFEIASASPRILGISFGADDFTLNMGIVRTKEQTEILYPRSVVAVAARGANTLALDTPCVDFRDQEGLLRDSLLAKNLGFKGKWVIHPSQVETVNKVFSPSLEEIEYARRVVDAFETAKAKGSGAISLDSRMIDIPSAERAKRLLMLAEAIAKKEAPKG
ncbi:MAG: CoA ester lyase [Chloroflexi bacterium]|nr:CoA ester lyase [Chloroflexota bacterium]